jgi:hypothetical protein
MRVFFLIMVTTLLSLTVQAQTKALLSKFPDTSQIEFVYEDTLRKKKPKSKK